MLGRVVTASRTWMCTMAAPALAASMADCAICCGVTEPAGFFPGVSADPVTAHEIITLRCMVAPLPVYRHEFNPPRAHATSVVTLALVSVIPGPSHRVRPEPAIGPAR